MAAIETLGAAAPRVLALDLSVTASGIAWPDGDLDTIRTTTSDGDGRLVQIRNRITDILDVTLVDLVAVEDLPTHAHGAGITGMVHGAVRTLLIDHQLPYVLVAPATLKVYATGRGNAPKPDMRVELLKRTGVDVRDDNQVDAAWLRLLALDLAGTPELTLPQTHRRALIKLTAPTIFEVVDG